MCLLGFCSEKSISKNTRWMVPISILGKEYKMFKFDTHSLVTDYQKKNIPTLFFLCDSAKCSKVAKIIDLSLC